MSIFLKVLKYPCQESNMTVKLSLHSSLLDMHAIEEIILQTLHFDKYCGSHLSSPLLWGLTSR